MDYLMLVDRLNPVPEEVIQNLRFGEAGGVRLERQAASSLDKLLRAAENEGIVIKALSGFRSIEYQQELWDKSISALAARGLSHEEAEEEVSRTLARPGHSEHNCGLAVDLCTPFANDTEEDFYLSPQARWLCRRASSYGFILRYPRMKEHITGIDYEPWHYRYVGAEAALLIRQSGLCLEEFLHFYSDEFRSCL